MTKRYLDRSETKKQSIRAFDRWKDIWIANCKANKECYKQHEEIKGSKINKQAILFAYGPSFQENVAAVKAHNLHHEYDILCVDKALKGLIENGIYPQFCNIADAQVSFEKYGNVDPIHVKKTILIAAATGNSKWVEHWTRHGGKVYFTINKDGINTHRIYRDILDYRKGEATIIPASSNVGNALYVIATLVLGYSEILLAAYDYSYQMTGNYYGNESDPIDTNHNYRKHSFNNHDSFFDINGDLVQVSNNMKFSAKWLMDFIQYIEKTNKNVTINVTGHGILGLGTPIKQGRIKRRAA